jgi:RNA polymerase sigma-70 factor (ECF subfamily)
VETLQLNEWLDRWRAGDEQARDRLVEAAYPRLEVLGRKMLAGFPNVRPLHDTQDVVQNAAVRLLRSLRQVEPPPATTREFFGLAAMEIRRELLDLARSARFSRQVSSASGLEEAADDREPAEDLERWEAFHEAVARLPAEEREVMGLAFYHGWTQAQIAALFRVSERTVARRWHSACLQLQTMLNGKLPGNPPG